MPSGVRTTDKMEQRVVKRVLEGVPISQVARQMMMRAETVRDILRRHGVALPGDIPRR